MSIYSDKGTLKIEGSVGDVLADLSMIIYGMQEGGMAKHFIDTAIETGFEKYKKENKGTNESKDFRKLLRNLGLEDF